MMGHNSEDSRIGTVLNDRYRIIERIGAGGMAVVYRGERLELGRPVAIKFLQEVMLQYPKFIGRFESEAKAMSKLAHPYCVSVIDFGVEGAPYIVMDFVVGKTLKAILREERLAVPRAMGLTRQILAGISHAHSQGIIHRDIKPENIMISDAKGMGEHVRIFDFGLAKLLGNSPAGIKMSSPSIVAGTPNYMAPEQSRGIVVDERADLYAIGIILFEILTGEKPFIHDDFVEVVRMHRDAPRPTLTERTEDREFSPELEDLIAKAMATDPEERFQTADEFIEALNATPEGSEAVEAPPVTGEVLTEKQAIGKTFSDVPTMYMDSGSMLLDIKKRVKKMKVGLPVAAVLVLLLGVLGYALFSGDDDGDAAALSDAERARNEANEKSIAAEEAARKAAEAKDAAEAAKKAAEAAEQAAKQIAASEKDGEGPSEDERESKDLSLAAVDATPVESIKDVRELISAGKTDAAIAGLRKLRKQTPQNGYYVLMLANLYFDKGWWGDALEHYRAAVRISPAYRSRGDINKNLIAMLSGKRIYRKASQVIQNNLGRHALPHLRRAAKRDKSPIVRRRAAQLVKKISH